MFAPAPLTGWLTDRVGPVRMAAAGCAILIAAGALAATAGHGALTFAAGLTLLGVGWNVNLVAGSTLLVSAVPVAHRPRIEAIGELSMGVAAATATAMAGPVVAMAGYETLAGAGAIAAAALAPLLFTVARRGVPRAATPAPRMLS
jgi:MFS family permease